MAPVSKSESGVDRNSHRKITRTIAVQVIAHINVAKVPEYPSASMPKSAVIVRNAHNRAKMRSAAKRPALSQKSSLLMASSTLSWGVKTTRSATIRTMKTGAIWAIAPQTAGLIESTKFTTELYPRATGSTACDLVSYLPVSEGSAWPSTLCSAWFREFDQAPSKVLAHRHAGLPGHHRRRLAVRTTREHPWGGSPCQDISLSARRAGMKDGTRSERWSEYLKAITGLRPDRVVNESVRGLYRARADSEMEPCPWCRGDGDDEYHLRALDVVLVDLSAVGFDAEWTGVRASDVGAPHGRFG